MPLDLTKLTLDPGIPGAQGADYPATREACAAAWAAAVGAYAQTVAPPLLQPVAPAQAALEAALVSAFAQPFQSMVPALEAAFSTFAIALVPLMAPAWVAVPPPGPVGFAGLFSMQPMPETRQEGVERCATLIDAWMRTGTATLPAPPNTPTTWL